MAWESRHRLTNACTLRGVGFAKVFLFKAQRAGEGKVAREKEGRRFTPGMRQHKGVAVASLGGVSGPPSRKRCTAGENKLGCGLGMSIDSCRVALSLSVWAVAL
jgi:hypothetical protein